MKKKKSRTKRQRSRIKKTPEVKKIKFAENEKIARLPVRKTPRGHRFAITNYGRTISYTTVPEEGYILKPGRIRKYFGVSIGRKTFLVHRLVAIEFVRQYKTDQRSVIHKDYNNANNYFENLKWVNRADQEKHVRSNPSAKKIGNQKLTEDRVRIIKRKLLNGKTRLKMIGKQFGVSDMQIHRIKTGENWGHVKI
ncbi:MAG: hypothetical protein JJE09_08045 [Bacteroidia bacterium]|nr:hypothetical protein [Bacteroidia bacterium]